MTKERPTRIYFTSDDPAELWSKGDTGDDLGTDGEGRRQIRLDHFDEAIVILDDPYGKGLIKPLLNEDEDKKVQRWTDEDLDAYLDSREENDAEG